MRKVRCVSAIRWAPDSPPSDIDIEISEYLKISILHIPLPYSLEGTIDSEECGRYEKAA
jgi:hypothetical protein